MPPWAFFIWHLARSYLFSMQRRLNLVDFPLTLPILALYLRHQALHTAYFSYFSMLGYMMSSGQELFISPVLALAYPSSFYSQ
ncbi:hypothetical protein DEU56DRAFT_787057 [Suillus clintonianus]|uniref:uncharacterized protein n=1 Tax=Suillus clintonianus TaxID=1904413 RepID=UPI001B872ECE|nr:uncharacterized protein DEU56DRAFT_787057 [Suillus clintonianus]KAG2146250.1 hypothetical protein DEU56DRAFT_787057 [Suillus clintonianus]